MERCKDCKKELPLIGESGLCVECADRFMRWAWDGEGIYNNLLAMVAMLEQHGWSKRMTQRDADFVSDLRGKMITTANHMIQMRRVVRGK